MSFRRWGGIAIVVTLLIVAVVPAQRAADAALMLLDVSAGPRASLWKRLTAAPRVMPVNYRVETRPHAGVFYLPGGGRPRAGIVLTPGVAPGGWKDPDLVAFAESLARARFAVLVPRIPGFEAMQVHAGDVREVSDAFTFLSGNPAWAPRGRAGIFGLSYATGLGVLACLQAPPGRPVRFLMGVGGYYDLMHEIRFATTGYFRVRGHWHYETPSPYGQWVAAESAMPFLPPADARLLQRMVQARLQNPRLDLAPLAAGLGPPGRAVYAVLENRNPLLTPRLLAALPPPMQADLSALDLSNKNLHVLSATRFILVHGMDDPIVPYSESMDLAAALPPGRARLFLIHHILGHVSLHPAHLASRAFWTQDLPDYWHLYQAIYALLGQRG